LKNNVAFVMMLLFANISHIMWLSQSYWFLSSEPFSSHLGFELLRCWLLLKLKYFWGSFWIFFVFELAQFLGQMALLIGQCKLVFLDATTFEELEHQKRIYNRGFLLNVKNFFGIAGAQQIDYGK
jgi:hypothetical protein